MLNILDDFLSVKPMSETDAFFLSAWFPIDRYLRRLISLYCFHLPSLLLLSAFYPQEPLYSATMAPAKLIDLADYRPILVSHHQEYRDSKGADRQDILAGIMTEIVAQSKGTIQKDLLKVLGQVSYLI